MYHNHTCIYKRKDLNYKVTHLLHVIYVYMYYHQTYSLLIQLHLTHTANKRNIFMKNIKCNEI